MKKLFLRTPCEILDITGFVEVLDNTVINMSFNNSIGKFPKKCSTIFIKANGDITVSQCSFDCISERMADLKTYGFVLDDSIMESEQVTEQELSEVQSVQQNNNGLHPNCLLENSPISKQQRNLFLERPFCYVQSNVTNVIYSALEKVYPDIGSWTIKEFLIKFGIEELKDIRGFGKSSIKKLNVYFKMYGLTLRYDELQLLANKSIYNKYK